MIINKTNLDIWYRRYTKQFERSKKYVKSRGGATRGLDMLDRKEFEIEFYSAIEDMPKKSGGQIAETMAKQEVIPQSWRQAEVHARAHVEKFGGNFDNLRMRYYIGAEDAMFADQARRRAELDKLGYTISQINLKISQEYYGS